ncbi:hypothetical protein LSG31_12995 [Fodinisporobacter ferrooxydans]|uniref:Uncharacterized protein n=1 Tax=Fodinisporobacter ferrooxydans TaxID=2901836 RepID=A0ABY4CEB1_9BACL|nr:hypothetical protein LSG31_12995 [Alicyclobacillaceae bacterium MYW30-H2]
MAVIPFFVFSFVIALLVDFPALKQNSNKKQWLVYVTLLGIGEIFAAIYMVGSDLPSPVRSLEIFVNPVSTLLWGQTW